ncbi:hypothetical protein ACSU1N_06845 [Thermogladius sp. 4427co]|uniref:hypothetical protein n=1 Tax=Thermogladius sp. 4427co TaxID=3450718 RepID=UPI003F7AF974
MSIEDKEFALRPVPLGARLSFLAVLMMWAGLTLDPSAPYLSAWWASIFNFSTLLLGLVIGNLILSLFSATSGYIATKHGLSYALAAQRVYGVKGVAVPALWAGIVSLGWLSFSTGLTADGFWRFLNHPSWTYYIYSVILVVIFGLTAYFGVKYIVYVAYGGVPALMLLVPLGVYFAITKYGAPHFGAIDLRTLPLITGFVIGTFVNGSIVLSFDFQRFAKTIRESIAISFINFLGYWTFIIALSGIAPSVLGKDLYDTYIILGLGGLALITLFLLAWTSVDAQFYSYSLSWTLAVTSLGKKVRRENIVLLGMAISLILTLIGIHRYAVYWLSLLTSISLPAGVVIWTDYILNRKLWEKPARIWNIWAFISWFSGSIVILVLYMIMGLWYGILIGFAVASGLYSLGKYTGVSVEGGS